MWDVTHVGAVVDHEPPEFLLTHPVWDVTCFFVPLSCPVKFLLTHPVWDVTILPVIAAPLTGISTHTSRVGCDEEIRAYPCV